MENVTQGDNHGNNGEIGHNEVLHDNNDTITMDNGQTRFIMASNGIKIETRDAQAVIAFDLKTQRLYLGSGNDAQEIDVCIGGKLVSKTGAPLIDITIMEKEIQALRAENAELRQLVDEMYFAPGMPGYEKCKERFEEMITKDYSETDK